MNAQRTNPLVAVYVAAEVVWWTYSENLCCPVDPPVCKSTLKEISCLVGAGTAEPLQPVGKALFLQWLEQVETGRGSSSPVPCTNPKIRAFLSLVLSFPISRLCSWSLHLLLLLPPSLLPQERARGSWARSAGIPQFALLSPPHGTFPRLRCSMVLLARSFQGEQTQVYPGGGHPGPNKHKAGK